VPEKALHEVNRHAKELYDKGLASMERNAPDAAVHFFTQAVSLEPGFLKARQALRIARVKKFGSGGAMSRMFGSVTGSTSLAKAFANTKKDPLKALEAAEQALSSNPHNVQALKLMADAAETLGFLQTAIFAMETANDESPKNVAILLKLGHLYQVAHDAEKASQAYEEVLKIDPNNSEAYAGKKDSQANEAMRKGNWDKADSYRDVMKDSDEAASLEQAGKIFKDEDVVRAQMAEVFNLTTQQPENIAHWRKLGDLALQVNEFDYAIQCYEHAFNLSKGADGTLEGLVSQAKIKKHSFLIEQKQEQVQASPEDENLKQELQDLQTQRDQLELEEAEALVRHYPNDLDLHYSLAQTYIRQGHVDKAIREFQAAAANPKTRIACTYWMGRCYREKGMLDMALQRFKAAADQTPGMDLLKKEILYNMGLTFEQTGDKKAAIEQFKLIYDVDVSYGDVAQRIEDYYRSQSGQG
jgi:tetratricopeptide (TPR) repeat protein